MSHRFAAPSINLASSGPAGAVITSSHEHNELLDDLCSRWSPSRPAIVSSKRASICSLSTLNQISVCIGGDFEIRATLSFGRSASTATRQDGLAMDHGKQAHCGTASKQCLLATN